MGVYEDITAWSVTRPAWLRDALRRLAQQGLLTERDFDELVEVALTAAVAPGYLRAPEPFAAVHVPAAAPAGTDVELRAVFGMSNVNALASDARLDLEPSGITMVYGDNGSGKSGYVRILKRVCRARSTPSPVLPNVMATDTGRTSAEIEYQVGGSVHIRHWDTHDANLDDLGAVSVFDRDCAAVYVVSENEVAYRPLGLDLLDSLASAARTLRRRFGQMLDRASLRMSGPPAGVATSAVLEGIWPVDPDRTGAALAALPGWDEGAAEALQEVDRALATPSPAEAAAGLRARNGLLLRAATEASRIGADIDLVDGLQASRARVSAAEVALADARLVVTRPEELPGVGGPLWRAMWEATAHYSADAAYVGQAFPFTGDHSRCVLCAQLLSDGATSRLISLAAVITTQLEQIVQQERDDLSRRETALLRLLERNAAPGLTDDLRASDGEAAERLTTLLGTAADLAHRVSDHEEDPTPIRADTVASENWLRERAVPLRARSDLLARAADPAEVLQLRVEALNLHAREWVATNVDALLADVATMRIRAAITRATADCDTQPITIESGVLTERYVTDALRASFARELELLSSNTVRIRIVPRGQYGSVYHRLELDGAVVQDTHVADVVSEGEFRAIALASFFAELGQSESHSGIVLDDPVSSLDHLNRERTAQRIAREASVRQVVVFTHDLVFLHDLTTAAEALDVPLAYRRLRLTRTHTGWALPEPPWLGMKVRQRVEVLQEELNRLRLISDSGDLDTYQRDGELWYGGLRETWERAVEEILFADAIGRFRNEVRTGILTTAKVWLISEQDILTIDHGMTKSSAWLRGHDQPATVNRPMPPPDELRDDLASLREWASEVVRRRH